MKIKKKHIGKIIWKGRRRIELSEVMDERTMQMLIAEHPKVVEAIKKPKKKSEKEDTDATS